jgi:hypothetical protein
VKIRYKFRRRKEKKERKNSNTSGTKDEISSPAKNQTEKRKKERKASSALKSLHGRISNSQYLHTKPMQRIGQYVLHPDTENKRGVPHTQRGDTKRAGGRAHARVCAQKNREKIRSNDGEEERRSQQWTKRTFSNNCDFVSASEGDE